MDLLKIKKLIQARVLALRTLQAEAEAGCDTVILDQSCVGRLSRMDAMQSQAMNQEAQRRRNTELLQLARALERIEADDYGYCEACDEQISEGRLMIDLASRYCVQCADQQERGV